MLINRVNCVCFHGIRSPSEYPTKLRKKLEICKYFRRFLYDRYLKSFAIKLRKSAISASFSFSYAIIQKYCCPLNMIDLSELVVFPTSSDDLRLSKPSCACALVLFFGSYCVWRAFYHGGQRFLPVFLRVLQEPLYVDIVHQHDSHYRGQP